MVTIAEMLNIYKDLAKGPARKIDEVDEPVRGPFGVSPVHADEDPHYNGDEILWEDEHGPVYALRRNEERVGENRDGKIYVDPETGRYEQQAVRFHELGHNEFEDETLATRAGASILLGDMEKGEGEEKKELIKVYELMKDMERKIERDPMEKRGVGYGH